MLDGKDGWPQQLAMRMLAAVARAFNAQSLIPVVSVHLSLSGVSVGEPGMKLFTSLAQRGGKFVVPTSLNVLSMDRRAAGRDPALRDKEKVQSNIFEACKKMGGIETFSCNPFLLGVVPKLGESVAWNESATAPYINSVLGGRTNREGATALASALSGFTVEYGMHLDANRRGSIVVEVDGPIRGSDAFSILGGAIGRICGSEIPVIDGIATRPTTDEFTAFCAAFATTTPVAMFHMVGITPEAPTRTAALTDPAAPVRRIDAALLAEEARGYSTAKSDRVDIVSVGCPHASLEQIREVADLFGSEQVHAATTFFLQTSHEIAIQAEAVGLAERLRRSRVELTADTCVHISYREAPPGSTLATNSLKIAYMTPSHDVDVFFGSLQQCVRAGVTGRWN